MIVTEYQQMAADSKDKPVELSPKNSQIPVPKPQVLKRSKTLFLIGITARLFTWFTIITILFRCPPTHDQLRENSSRVCKSYFHAREVLAPHIRPYYNEHIVHYVETARPHYVNFESRVVTPTTVLVKRYCAPRAAQLQTLIEKNWEEKLQPKLHDYGNILYQRYRHTLGAEVDAAYMVINPYYEYTKINAIYIYNEVILPSYFISLALTADGYVLIRSFTINTAYPCARWAIINGFTFIDQTVWPQLKLLYRENIEPQLMKIGQRLGRYREGMKTTDKFGDVKSSSDLPKTSADDHSSENMPPPLAQPTSSLATPEIEVDNYLQTSNEDRSIQEKAEKVIAQDLRVWQEKFAEAADEGADELEISITDITDKFIQIQVKTEGKSHLLELEKAIETSLDSLKSSIISIVQNSENDIDSSQEITAAVRKTGIGIKQRAQELRIWRQTSEQEMTSLISKAISDTLGILDTIQEAGLQEIGMRWAWMDGVTHKDWAKYHALKTNFAKWRLDVELVGTEHPGIVNARTAFNVVENKAMSIAEDAAKELAWLKEIGLWKLTAKETSNDFKTNPQMDSKASQDKTNIENLHETKLSATILSQDDKDASTISTESLPQIDILSSTSSESFHKENS